MSLLANQPETFGASLWSALTPPGPDLPRLEGTVTAETVVIGAGFLGLSLALHLAEQGRRVVLLEAREPGYGASGRTTAFIVPSFTARLGPADVAALLGPRQGERLSRFVGASGKMLFDLVARLGLACDAEPTGWIQAAHTPVKARLLEERVKQWQALGQPVGYLGHDEARRLTGSGRYLAALLDRSGGQINPLAFVRGLARAVVAAGGTVYRDSAVTKLARQGNGWRIETASGAVEAATAVFTTNALIGDLLPDVRRSLIPIRSYQVATQPLGPDVRARIAPLRQPVADLHRHPFAYRWSPDNRLVSGGIAVVNDHGAVPRLAQYFRRRLAHYLPDLPPLRADYAWNGVVATTPDFLPTVWSVGPGLYAPIGCNGRGVAVTTALGKAVAEFLVSGDPQALPVEVTPPRPHAHAEILAHGPSLWLAWNRLKDWREDRIGA
jgi:glycine/D-amino acid oxidase-like deaminating enzyme